MQLPGPLREAIEQELAGYNSARLQAAAARLSLVYREDANREDPYRQGGPTAGALADDLDRAAYLAVRMPATFAAVATALRWTREALREEDSQIRSVLDLGSGPGTAIWAALQEFPMLASATAVERDPRLIEIGRRLAASAYDPVMCEGAWLCGDLTAQLPEGSWDLVVCAYALNEIGGKQRAGLIRQAWARCAKLLVIVEPGTKAGFANVLAVRSQMLSPQHANPGRGGEPMLASETSPFLVAPCPNSLACPMAIGGVPGKPDVGDWCHFAARVERTATHRRVKQAMLGHEDEKFSYVAFMRNSAMAGGPHPPSFGECGAQNTQARIVRHPRIFSGYTQLTLCRAGEIATTTVTRSQKEDWRRLKRLSWGDRW